MGAGSSPSQHPAGCPPPQCPPAPVVSLGGAHVCERLRARGWAHLGVCVRCVHGCVCTGVCGACVCSACVCTGVCGACVCVVHVCAVHACAVHVCAQACAVHEPCMQCVCAQACAVRVPCLHGCACTGVCRVRAHRCACTRELCACKRVHTGEGSVCVRVCAHVCVCS